MATEITTISNTSSTQNSITLSVTFEVTYTAKYYIFCEAYKAGSNYVAGSDTGSSNTVTGGKSRTDTIEITNLESGTNYNIIAYLYRDDGTYLGIKKNGSAKTSLPPLKTYYALVKVYKNGGTWGNGGDDPKRFSGQANSRENETEVPIYCNFSAKGGLNRDGYTLKGFGLSETSTRVEYTKKDQTIYVTSSQTNKNAPSVVEIYAIWEKNPTTYYGQLAINKNGGSWGDGKNSNERYWYGSSTVAAEFAEFNIGYDIRDYEGLERTGYTLLGFSSNSSASSPTFTRIPSGYVGIKATSTNPSNRTLSRIYAIWKKRPDYRKVEALADSRLNSYYEVKFQASVEMSGWNYNGTYRLVYQIKGQNDWFEVPDMNNIVFSGETFSKTTYNITIKNLSPGTTYNIRLGLKIVSNNIIPEDTYSNYHKTSTIKDPRTFSINVGDPSAYSFPLSFVIDKVPKEMFGNYQVIYEIVDDSKGKQSLSAAINTSKTTLKSKPDPYEVSTANKQYIINASLYVVGYNTPIKQTSATVKTLPGPRNIVLQNNTNKNGCHTLDLNAEVTVDGTGRGRYWIQYSLDNSKSWHNVRIKNQSGPTFFMKENTSVNFNIIIKDFNLLEPGQTYKPAIRLVVPEQNNHAVAVDESKLITSKTDLGPGKFEGFNMKSGQEAGKPVFQQSIKKYYSVYLTKNEWKTYLNKVKNFVDYHNDFNGTNLSFQVDDYMKNVVVGGEIYKTNFVNLCNNILSKMPNYFDATLPDFNKANSLQADLFIGLKNYLNKTIYKE